MRTVLAIYALCAVAMVVVSFATGGRGGHRTVNVVGSTSIQPFAEMLSEEYSHGRPGAKVEVQGGGSTAGLLACAEGIADIGTCSRGLKEDEARRFRGITIALDGLAVVVHRSNPVSALSMAQIRDIFSGAISNWREVGGNDQRIRLITREEGSGTREAFVKLVMQAKGPAGAAGGVSAPPANGGKEAARISRRALTQESNGAVKELVRHDPAAIGYMSLGLVGEDLKILTVDGAHPSTEAVAAGRYPLVRPFLFVVKGQPGPEAQAFIDFVLSPSGQQALEKEGLVRAP